MEQEGTRRRGQEGRGDGSCKGGRDRTEPCSSLPHSVLFLLEPAERERGEREGAELGESCTCVHVRMSSGCVRASVHVHLREQGVARVARLALHELRAHRAHVLSVEHELHDLVLLATAQESTRRRGEETERR